MRRRDDKEPRACTVVQTCAGKQRRFIGSNRVLLARPTPPARPTRPRDRLLSLPAPIHRGLPRLLRPSSVGLVRSGLRFGPSSFASWPHLSFPGERRAPLQVSWVCAHRNRWMSLPAPLLQHKSIEHTGQLGEVRLRLKVEDEIEDGVVCSLIDDAGDDTPVLCDHFIC